MTRIPNFHLNCIRHHVPDESEPTQVTVYPTESPYAVCDTDSKFGMNAEGFVPRYPCRIDGRSHPPTTPPTNESESTGHVFPRTYGGNNDEE